MAKFHNIYCLLWLDTTYLVNKIDLEIRFDNFVQMYVFAIFQLVTSALIDPIMLVAAFFSVAYL